jgi:hypothetical protein
LCRAAASVVRRRVGRRPVSDLPLHQRLGLLGPKLRAAVFRVDLPTPGPEHGPQEPQFGNFSSDLDNYI